MGVNRKIKPVVVFFLMTIATHVHASSIERTPQMSEIKSVKYLSSVTVEEFPLSVSVDASHVATVSLGSSLWRGTAGIFSTKLSESNWSALSSALKDPAFTSMQSPESLLPGTPSRDISVHFENGQVLEKWAVGNPESFVAAEKLFLDIVTQSVEHPEHAVRMTSFEFPQASSGDNIKFSAVVANVGKSEVLLPNPRSSARHSSGFVLHGVRTDKPASTIGPRDYKFWHLDGDAIANIKASSTDPQFIRLSPGESFISEFQIPTGSLEGRCTMTLSFSFDMRNEQEQPLGSFEVVSQKQGVVLSGK
jgi:hypothetical protein